MTVTNNKLAIETLLNLYKDQLVVLEELRPNTAQAASAGVETSSPFRYEGENLRQVLVVVPGNSLSREHRSFLTNILKACRLTLKDIALVMEADLKMGYDDLKSHVEFSTVLLFGVSPLKISLPINFPAFKIHRYNDRNFLLAPPVAEMAADTEAAKLLKSKLWLCLKELFQL